MDDQPPQLSEGLPLPQTGPGSLDDWNTKIQQAKDAIRRTREKFQWNVHVERYVNKGAKPSVDTVILPKDYSYTEQKKPLLFYQLPEVVLTPARPDVQATNAELFQNILNELVGPDYLNAKAVIDEVLTDVLVPAGFGVVKVGYEAFVNPQQPEIPMQVGEEPVIDPMTGQPAMDPMTGQPMTQPIEQLVPNIMRERYFLERISPVDFLFDTGFRGSDWSKCSWMGLRFRMAPALVQALYGIDPDRLRASSIEGQQPGPDESLAPDRTVQNFGGIDGTEIWYRAIDVDPTVGDPQLVRTFVLFEGLREPVGHSDSPYQEVENGKVVGGQTGFPIFPLTLRYVPDSPIPPSDCAQSRVIVDELSKGRTQMLQQRDRNLPLRGVDTEKVSKDAVQKLMDGQIQEIIPLAGLSPGDTPFYAIQQAAFPQENFNFNNFGERDLQECWALSSNNLGSSNTSGRTATELNIMQQGTETRMQAEQVKAMQWWTLVVQGLGAIVQMYPIRDFYVNVLGPQGEQQLTAWTKQDIAGRFAFSVRPDSARRLDQTAERKFRLDVYQLFRNDPTINAQELAKWAAPALGFDPAKVLAPPKEPQPEPPNISVTISDEGLNPMSPSYTSVVALLKSRGIQLQTGPPPQQGQLPGGPAAPGGAPPTPPNPGAVQGVSPINKHQMEQTGRVPNSPAARVQ